MLSPNFQIFRIPVGFCVFLSDTDQESKICEKLDPDLESLFNFDSIRSLCGHSLSKNMCKFLLDRWYPDSEQELDSEI